MAYRSRQRKHGGGKFKSERQRRFMWAVVPSAARKWAHNRNTTKSNWAGRGRKRPGIGTFKAAGRKGGKKAAANRRRKRK